MLFPIFFVQIIFSLLSAIYTCLRIYNTKVTLAVLFYQLTNSFYSSTCFGPVISTISWILQGKLIIACIVWLFPIFFIFKRHSPWSLPTFFLTHVLRIIQGIVFWIKRQRIVNFVEFRTRRLLLFCRFYIWLFESRIKSEHFYVFRSPDVFELLLGSLYVLFECKFIEFGKDLSSELTLSFGLNSSTSFLGHCHEWCLLRRLMLWRCIL